MRELLQLMRRAANEGIETTIVPNQRPDVMVVVFAKRKLNGRKLRHKLTFLMSEFEDHELTKLFQETYEAFHSHFSRITK